MEHYEPVGERRSMVDVAIGRIMLRSDNDNSTVGMNELFAALQDVVAELWARKCVQYVEKHYCVNRWGHTGQLGVSEHTAVFPLLFCFKAMKALGIFRHLEKVDLVKRLYELRCVPSSASPKIRNLAHTKLVQCINKRGKFTEWLLARWR